MKIAINEKINAVALIKEACLAGAGKFLCCQILCISLRTFQRWDQKIIEDQRKGSEKRVVRKLSEDERNEIIALSCSDRFKNLNPYEIVSILAEDGIYLASERTFYRILAEKGLIKHRSNRKPGKKRGKPKELIATGPDQVWCWDITYLKSSVSGLYYYCYMIKDIWTKEIIGWAVHEKECAELAKDLFRSLKNKHNLRQVHLHSDNGSSMKASTFLITLYDLGVMSSFSRPSCSNDNPYIESLFSTMKYVPGYPNYFKDISTARDWMEEFVHWYNNIHRHSAIGYVTPAQRRNGFDKKLFEKRNQTIENAHKKHPERWGKKVRKWEVIEKIILNPNKEENTVEESA